jgi:hypothetical protein
MILGIWAGDVKNTGMPTEQAVSRLTGCAYSGFVQPSAVKKSVLSQ